MSTDCFNGIVDGKGNFKFGISDMKTLDYLSEDHLNKFDLSLSKFLVLYSNVNPNTLDYIFGKLLNSDIEIIYEPVSKEKCAIILLKDYISRINTLKVNHS